MGYYTRHELTILEGDDFNTDYAKEIGEISDYGECFKIRLSGTEWKKI